MDEINKIRKCYYKEGNNINEIAKRFNRSWHTIKSLIFAPRQTLKDRGKRPNRASGVLTQRIIEEVNKYLDNELKCSVKKKQKYSATFIYRDLVDKGIYSGSSRSLRGLIARLRNKRGQAQQRTFLPLDFPFCSAIQIDHGEVDCIINGYRRTRYLFVASIPGASLRFCQLYECKSKEAWGDFHERTFRFFGGISPKVVYDNDSVLIKSIIGLEHKQTEFSLGLEEHYGFESHFCNVGAGYEKGSVENAVGYCRRNYLAGCKDFESISKANEHLDISCKKCIFEGVHYKTKVSLQSLFDKAAEVLAPLTPPIKWRHWHYGRVNNSQLLCYDNHQYSVPQKYCGSRLRVSISAFDVEIFDENENLVTKHQRLFELGEDSLELGHYLEQLQKKPGALNYCKAFDEGKLSTQVKELWRRFKNRYPERKANQELINTFLLFRKHDEEKVSMSIDLALEYNAIESAAIENIVRQFDEKLICINSSLIKDKLNQVPLVEFTFDLTIYNALCEEKSHAS
jgi:hypothetical protein